MITVTIITMRHVSSSRSLFDHYQREPRSCRAGSRNHSSMEFSRRGL
jgi:hypothetical protein